MASEVTGHVRNVTNFEQLISSCTGYGAVYNPSNPNLSLSKLNTQLVSAKSALKTLNSARTPWQNAVNAREKGFNPISKLMTRVIGALESSGVDHETIDSAKSLSRKIQGRRSSPKDNPAPPNPESNESETPANRSSSQLAFDNRIDNIDKLIELLASKTEYAPNEADLTVASLTALLADLRALNSDVIALSTPYDNARIARDKILYQIDTGLVDIAFAVKKYVKSIFGSTNANYKLISGLRFVKL